MVVCFDLGLDIWEGMIIIAGVAGNEGIQAGGIRRLGIVTMASFSGFWPGGLLFFGVGRCNTRQEPGRRRRAEFSLSCRPASRDFFSLYTTTIQPLLAPCFINSLFHGPQRQVQSRTPETYWYHSYIERQQPRQYQEQWLQEWQQQREQRQLCFQP